MIDISQLNILQLALFYGLKNLFKYLLKEHKGLNQKPLDPRIILLSYNSDESFTLRYALQLRNISAFSLMWESFPYLYSE